MPDQQGSTTPQEESPSAEIRRPVILIADDEYSIRRLLVQVLQSGGYDTREAGDGLEALVEIARSRPDLVLMDLEMPKCEGLETIIKLHGSYPELKIIAMSGAMSSAFLANAKHLGAVDALGKPINMELLLARIQAHLSSE